MHANIKPKPALPPTDGGVSAVVQTAVGHGWRVDAACREADPQLFFPDDGEDVGPALDFCRSCTVRAFCLAAAISAGERHGVWGGLTEGELRSFITTRSVRVTPERGVA